MTAKTCIELVPIFSTLTSNEMMEIAKITVSNTYKKGEMVYLAGEKKKQLFVIHEGKVKITRLSSSGKEQIIRVLGPGNFMGELSLFSDAPMINNAEVLDDTTVCIIDGEKLKTLMIKYPAITFKILEELSTRLEKAETLIENLGINNVETRIAQVLLNLVNERGEVVLDTSKRDLASYIGMSQETLSRKLSYFQEKGWIKLMGHRRIILLSKENLRNLL